MADHAHALTKAELLKRTAQDFTTLQVMRNRAITEINAVVQKQTVLAWDPQMVGDGHGQDEGIS